MKSLLTVFIILTTIPLMAQNHFVGAQGGVALTNIEVDGSTDNRNYRLGVLAGLNYQYQFKNKFQLGINVEYSQKGYDVVFEGTGGISTKKSSEEVVYDYDYISLPLKAGFSVGKKLSGFINLGVIPSFLVLAEINSAVIKRVNRGPIDASDDTNPIDIAGMLELGGSLKLGGQIRLIAVFNAQRSFTNLEKNDILNDNPHHFGFGTQVGIQYRFIKK